MKNLSNAEKKVIRNKISKALEEGTFTQAKFARENNMSKETVRRLIERSSKLIKEFAKYVPRQKSGSAQNSKQDSEKPFVKEVSKDFNDEKGTGTVTTRSLDIKTVDDLLKIAEVNLDIWEVDRHLINSWEVTVGGIKTGTGQCETYTNYQVKVWLKRKDAAVSAMEDLYERMKSNSPFISVIKRKMPKHGTLQYQPRELEISLFDLHLGMRCYKGMADCDWTPDDAERITMEILEDLLELTAPLGPFERIIFPMGNDFLHTDNVYNTTTSFTGQPEADAWQKTFLRGELLGLAIMERMKKVAPVKVLSIPGNHARHSEIALGRILKAYYHNDENFEIDAGPSPFKFHSFGVNLLGFEHGHSIRQQVRLAALMANENRLDGVWEKARYCEFHCGDQHRKGSGKPHMFEEQGVSIEFLPGLCPPNEWHRIHSYNWQKRAGLAFIWDKTAGCVARFQRNIDNYTGKIMK